MINLTCKTDGFKDKDQRGFVLVIVLSLVIVVSGLGLLAMRHAQQESRTVGAYVDADQAVAAVDAAMAMAMADLRKSADYYQLRFSLATDLVTSTTDNFVDINKAQFAIPLNPVFFTDDVTANSNSDCVCNIDTTDKDGCVPLLSSPAFNDGQTGGEFYTTITYDSPMVGPCPPGFSCFDEQNYGWYIFGVNATSRFGPKYTFENKKFVESARATGHAQVTIGPIGAYGR
jgi:Tfp pilus assembly protein PilV